jgi:hypothetical protein
MPSGSGGGRLPNFLLLGANKAGTTSLYFYLRQHPDVFLTKIKEPMFFLLRDGRWVRDYVATNMAVTEGVRDIDEYRRMFAPGDGCRAVGEATTFYLAEPKVAEGIKELLDDPKLLAVLRHPAERAFSNYQMYRRWELEPLPTFEEAIAAEEWRRSTGWPLAYQYVQLGFYARQLRAYHEVLGPSSVRLYWSEDLAADTGRVVADIFTYLGVDPDVTLDTSFQVNTSSRDRWPLLHQAGRTRFGAALRKVTPDSVRMQVRKRAVKRPPFAPETRARLIDIYREDIAELEEISGRSLAHWLH